MTTYRGLIAVGLVCLVSACGEPEPDTDKKMLQTTATVRAPMSLGGAVDEAGDSRVGAAARFYKEDAKDAAR